MKKFLCLTFMFLAVALTATAGYSGTPDIPPARAVILDVPDLALCEPSGIVQCAYESGWDTAVAFTFRDYGAVAISCVDGFVLWNHATETPHGSCTACENETSRNANYNYRHFHYRSCTGTVPDSFNHRFKQLTFSRHVYPANS